MDSGKGSGSGDGAAAGSAGSALSGNGSNGFFTPNDKIDFSNVKIEPLFEESVDFDTFSKSDFRAVKVKDNGSSDLAFGG